MEGDEIGIVLSRVSELRSKINNCIDKATKQDKEGEEEEHSLIPEDEAGDVYDEAESLLNIRDALESLEEQLVCLQASQQQQRYERDAALAEIDHSRKILLKKLKEYKGGEALEVIDEASAFASETVEQNDDLLLPPYPNRPSRPLFSNNSFSSNISSPHKISKNGVLIDDIITTGRKTNHDSEEKEAQNINSVKGLRFIFGVAAKAVLTLVSVISVLSLAGFEPRLKKRGTHFKILDLFQKRVIEERRGAIECPPGKFLVMEDGEPRCLVKERVEIPFESLVATPDVNYGCG